MMESVEVGAIPRTKQEARQNSFVEAVTPMELREAITEYLEYGYLSAKERQRLMVLFKKDALTDQEYAEYERIYESVQANTEKHLEQIGLTPEENKAFLQALRRKNKKALHDLVVLSERRLEQTMQRESSTASRYACFEVNAQGRIVEYHPERDTERAALHEQILNDRLSDFQPSPDPSLLIVGGVPGAGKSTTVQEMQNFLEAIVIDPDLLKPLLMQGYQEENAAHVLAAHEESSWLAKRLFEEALKRKISIVYDGTFSNFGRFQTMLENAPRHGYRVSLAFVHGGAESWRRNSLLRSRAVKPKVFMKGLKGYCCLKDLCDKDGLASVLISDTSSPQSIVPRVLYDSRQGKKSAREIFSTNTELQAFIQLSNDEAI